MCGYISCDINVYRQVLWLRFTVINQEPCDLSQQFIIKDSKIQTTGLVLKMWVWSGKKVTFACDFCFLQNQKATFEILKTGYE